MSDRYQDTFKNRCSERMSVLRIWKNGVQTGEISDKRTGEPAGETAGETAYETTAKRQMNQQVKNQMKQQRKEQIKQTKQDERRRNTCGNIRKMSDTPFLPHGAVLGLRLLFII